jgi:replicative DNA helicase
MPLFPFDTNFQRSILRLMQTDDLFCMRVLQHVEAGFFTHEALGWIFKVIERYWRDYQLLCGDVPLRDTLRYVREDKLGYYSAEVDQVIFLGNVPSSNYVKDKLADFCKRNLFSIAHKESAALFNDGKSDEAYDVMATSQDKIREVDFGEIDRQWFFEELPERQRQRRALQTQSGQILSTGIPDLDRMADGGVRVGEVWAVLAYAKRCKTTWLINQGFSALRMYAIPVLHIALEGRAEQMGNRYDACFSDNLYKKVKAGEIAPQSFRVMQDEYRRLQHLLVIRTINDWDANVINIKTELEELKAHKFVPGLLIVDYMDLLRSRYKVESETAHQVAAARDLKRLVNQNEFACWSAWQAQRPKPNAHTKQHVLTSGNVADAYAKVRIVDAYGSLNATEEEMTAGEMRVFWEAHRDSPVHKTWLIKNDLSRMKMVTEVIMNVKEQMPDDKK